MIFTELRAKLSLRTGVPYSPWSRCVWTRRHYLARAFQFLSEVLDRLFDALRWNKAGYVGGVEIQGKRACMPQHKRRHVLVSMWKSSTGALAWMYVPYHHPFICTILKFDISLCTFSSMLVCTSFGFLVCTFSRMLVYIFSGMLVCTSCGFLISTFFWYACMYLFCIFSKVDNEFLHFLHGQCEE